MMKKLLGITLLIAVCLLCACAKKETAGQPETAGAQESVIAEEQGPASAQVQELAPEGKMSPELSQAADGQEAGAVVPPETTALETKPVSEIPAGQMEILTSKKWKESTQGISTMRLDKDGNGAFENANLEFSWSLNQKGEVAILIGDRGNVEPIYLKLTEDNKEYTLTQTNGEAVFKQE